MRSRLTLDLIAGGIVLALSAAAISGALRFPSASGPAPGPAVFPLLIALLWIPVGCALIVQECRAAPTAPNAATPVRPMVGLLALTVIYVIVMPRVGFIGSSALFLTVAIRSLGYRHWWRAGAIALSTAFGVYWLFAVIMKVPLPPGWLG